MSDIALRSGGLFTHRPFLFFLGSRALSSMAFQGTGVAIGWLVYDRTRNPFDLGLIGLCQFLPMVVLTFVVGHVADAFDRRRIGFVCQIVEALTLCVLSVGVWQGWLSLPAIFVAVALLGSVQAFERPTMAALLPGIVPSDALPRAIANSTSVMQTALVIGPSLAGLLYGVGPVVPFVVSTAMFAFASLSVTSIPHPGVTPKREPVTLKSVFAGAAFIRSRPVMLGTISLDLFAVLLGGATALLPVYARDILHAGPIGLGLLRTSPAIGAVAMSLVLGRFPLTRRVGAIMLVAVGIFGLATIVFAVSTNIALSVAMLLVLGAADTISVVVRTSLVQLLTPDAMRGRVNAINSLFIGTSNQLGEFESGTLASFVGPVWAVALGGLGTIAVVLLWTRLFPALPKVQTFKEA
ncbi:MAG TPA: MFS transporter [Devosia sp.]|jgi:MFS family permease|nr:MFS transporter [Devosia sp.]